MRCAKKGFTLLETLVTMGILLFLLGAIYAAFNCGLRFFTRSQGIAQMQQEAQASMDWMVKELSAATLVGSGVTANAIWFASAASPAPDSGNFSVDGFGALLWQKWVGYQPDSTGTKLVRTEFPFQTPLTSDNIVASVFPTGSASLLQGATPQRVLAMDLESFVPTLTVSSVKLTLVLSINAGTAQVTRFELDDEVHVGN